MLNLQMILLSLMALMLLPVTAVAGSIEGRLAYRKGDYVTALREFNAPDQGGPVGTYFQAIMYLHGEGVSRDDARGLDLLRISAEEGYSAAQYLLGLHFLYGLRVNKDWALAMSYLLAASADDDYRAVVLLKILEKGSRGARKDRERIVATVKQKAKSKVPAAQYTLAFMYLVGDGVPKDGVEEVRWYRAAATKNPRAAFMLSLMYHFGEGVPQNSSEAVLLMRTAADLGDYRAQFYLGTFYYQGIGSLMDRPAAAAWFRKSAVAGFAEAQLAYGMLLLSGDGVLQDKGQAIEWLSKAARQNNSKAKEVIGEMLTYRGQPNYSSMVGEFGPGTGAEHFQAENQLRLENRGLLLDQGLYGLKFSLPTLYDVYAPQTHIQSRSIWDKLQGGTFEIIFRHPN